MPIPQKPQTLAVAIERQVRRCFTPIQQHCARGISAQSSEKENFEAWKENFTILMSVCDPDQLKPGERQAVLLSCGIPCSGQKTRSAIERYLQGAVQTLSNFCNPKVTGEKSKSKNALLSYKQEGEVEEAFFQKVSHMARELIGSYVREHVVMKHFVLTPNQPVACHSVLFLSPPLNATSSTDQKLNTDVGDLVTSGVKMELH